ncbi:MAG: PAS domain-containing protein, partial [Pusillimonas sp.]|nr:PAS domain-containing protein [Pusillimonas sp.]
MQLGNLSDSQPETWGTSLPDFFEVMPNSLWLEDYSQLHDLFESWRAQGVSNLRAYLQEDNARVAQCSACIKVLHVNRKTLEMFNADSFEDLSGRLNEVLRDDMLEAHLEELEQLWAGNNRFESKSVNYTLTGERLDVLIRAVVLPDHKKRWDRVLVSLDNITELEAAHRRIQASEQYARGIFEYAPVSLWVEDFHRIKALLDEVRERGITDFRTFTDVHPDFVEQCMSEIKVLDVNQYTLDMFKATDKQDLMTRLPEVFRDDMRDHFREQLIDLWDGKLFMQREVLNYALDGNPLNIHL